MVRALKRIEGNSSHSPVVDTGVKKRCTSLRRPPGRAVRQALPTGYPGRVSGSRGGYGQALLVREHVGDVLREVRQNQRRTLREVSASAQVSLGYLSEVERGQKEPSSELLAAICQALQIPLCLLLREVSDRLALSEGIEIPDTVPDELVVEQAARTP